MSFKCGHCGEPQPSNTRPVKRAVRTRSRTYPAREAAPGVFRRQLDAGGEGYETVREMDLCPACALDPDAGHAR